MNADLGKTRFEPAEIDDLRDRLAAYKAANGLSWDQLAKVTGIPKGTVSAWVPGSYNGGQYYEAHDIAARAHRFFLGLEEREQLEAIMPEVPGYQPTPSSIRIMTCFALAHMGDMALVSTVSGCGKTSSAKQYAATRPLVFVITGSPAMTTTPPMLIALLEAMGERPEARTGYLMSHRVRRKLMNAGALIIVDEAQCLAKDALQELRAIHDATGCGIAFVGDETLPPILRPMTTLYSRLGIRHTQKAPLKDDLAMMAGAWGVTHGPELAMLQQLPARVGGGIRTLNKTMQLAVRGARGRGTPLELSDIKESAAQRYGEAV